MRTRPFMTLSVVRDIDGTTIEYEVEVGRRRLLDVMRVEQLKPGHILSIIKVA